MLLNDVLKEQRIANHLTQEQVAKKIEVSVRTYQKYESGEISNPSEDKIKLIAEYLNISVDDLTIPKEKLLEMHKKAMKDFADNWNSKSETERKNISSKVQKKWDADKINDIKNRILSYADDADCIDFFLKEDSTIDFEKCKIMDEILINQLKFSVNSLK